MSRCITLSKFVCVQITKLNLYIEGFTLQVISNFNGFSKITFDILVIVM